MNPIIIWHWCFTFFPSWKGTTVSSSACRIRTGQDMCLTLRDRDILGVWNTPNSKEVQPYRDSGLRSCLITVWELALEVCVMNYMITSSYVWRINSHMGLNTKKILFLKQVLRERWSLRHVKRYRTESRDYYLNTAVRPQCCVNTQQFPYVDTE